MQFKLSELIKKFGGELHGPDIIISGISPTDTAAKTDITFLSDAKYKAQVTDNIGAIIVKSLSDVSVDIPKIVTNNPYYYFTQVSRLFNPVKTYPQAIHASAVIASSASVASTVSIMSNVVIGENSKIGNHVVLHAGVVIGDNVTIEDNTLIYPNVVCYDNVTLGRGCIIHAGCILGSDGFGNAQDEKKEWLKIPQVGGLIIGNNVEIGANTTIDCGTLNPTIIRDGVRIDNLVQVAHNVEIGEHTAIASCVGIAGGTKIGRYCQIAGGAGITGHITIADHTVVGGATNISKTITTPDLYSSALTGMPYKEWARVVVGLRNLENTNKKIKELEQELNKLKG